MKRIIRPAARSKITPNGKLWDVSVRLPSCNTYATCDTWDLAYAWALTKCFAAGAELTLWTSRPSVRVR